jgi:hypothetical protein
MKKEVKRGEIAWQSGILFRDSISPVFLMIGKDPFCLSSGKAKNIL